MRGNRLWGFGIMSLGLIGLLVWIDAFFVSGWAGELFRGIGVEVIGAIITALGVIGLDRLYAEPDKELLELREEVRQLHAKIDRLLNGD
jgi:hypothetical protein